MERDFKNAISQIIEGWRPLYLAGLYCIIIPILMKFSYSHLTTQANFMIGLWIIIGFGLLLRNRLALVVAILGFPIGYFFDFIVSLLRVKSPFDDLAFFFLPPSSLLLSYITDLFTNEFYIQDIGEQSFLRFIYYYIHILTLAPLYGGNTRYRIPYTALVILIAPLCALYESIFSYNASFRGREMDFLHGLLIGTFIWVPLTLLKLLEYNVFLGIGDTTFFQKSKNPLLDAVRKDNIELVKRALSENTSNVNDIDSNGYTVLMHAIENEKHGVTEFLLNNGADVNIKNNDGFTALAFAIEKGNGDLIQELLNRGADANTKSNDGMTYLMIAAMIGSTEIMKIFLAKGNDVNDRKDTGVTALAFAAMHSQIDAIRLLLENGADVDTANNSGDTPLMFASYNGSIEVVTELMNKGAKLNARGTDGLTPLMQAAQAGHIDIVRLLASQGANVHIKDKNGNTARDYAKFNDHSEIVRLLK